MSLVVTWDISWVQQSFVLLKMSLSFFTRCLIIVTMQENFVYKRFLKTLKKLCIEMSLNMIYNISKHVSQVSTLMEIKRNEKYSNSVLIFSKYIVGDQCHKYILPVAVATCCFMGIISFLLSRYTMSALFILLPQHI